MPLRIAFDLDGVLADMESELFHQAEVLFGEEMMRRQHAPATDVAPPPTTNAGETPDDTAAGSASGADVVPGNADTAPALLKLNLTTRQQRRLWRHVETIENFWETLQELEPGAIQRLPPPRTRGAVGVHFRTKTARRARATSARPSPRAP